MFTQRPEPHAGQAPAGDLRGYQTGLGLVGAPGFRDELQPLCSAMPQSMGPELADFRVPRRCETQKPDATPLRGSFRPTWKNISAGLSLPIPPPPPPTPKPWHPLICCVSLQIYLFWAFHIQGITHHEALCVWLLSLRTFSVHLHASALRSFLCLNTIPSPPDFSHPSELARAQSHQLRQLCLD